MAIRMSGMVSGMDTEGIVRELMKVQNLKKSKVQNKITTTEWKQDKWKELNKKLYSFYTGSLSKLRMQGSFITKKATSSNEAKAVATITSGAPEGNHSVKIKQLASSQFVTGAVMDSSVSGETKLTDLGMTAGEGNQITVTSGSTTKTLTIGNDTTVNNFLQTLKDAGLNASYDTNQKRFFISSKTSGYDNAFTLSSTAETGTVDLANLGLHEITKSVVDGKTTVTGGGDMILTEPKDAVIIYNNAEITSSSNVITVNGITLTLKGTTGGLGTPDPNDDEVINIGVQKDTKSVYDMIKDFVKNYNELIKEMNESFDSPSAKGYSPLTDDQKESMTDDQIEKWEKKIKDALLRRDSTLGTLIDTMRTKLSGAVEVNGKKYSLASFGITSTNYTEKGLLHLYGDQEDNLVSGYEDKLMKALDEDPDTVMKVLNGLADELYSDLTEKMKSSRLNSALTLYNDKEMTSQITSYKEEMKTLEDKLLEMENRYFKQFSAMESAMAKMNSQSSSLASMLGLNNR